MPQNPPGKRPPKKSDPVVVRLSHQTKEAFQGACRREGRTPSTVLRELIEGYLRRDAMRERLRDINPERSLAMIWKSPRTRIAAAASTAAAALVSVTLLGAPSTAQYDYRTSFETLDANGDGVISLDEYAGGGSRSTISMEFGPPLWDSSAMSAWESDEATTFELEGAAVQQESHAEFNFMVDIDFRVADVDADGSVDFDEFVRRHEQLLSEQFAFQDKDGDGRLSSAELIGQSEPHGLPAVVFYVLDHNDDGAITLEEFQAGPDEA